MANSIEELISQFRTQMDDCAKPYFWSDSEIAAWLDEAQKIFAEKTRIFHGSEDVAVLSADDGYFDMPTYIIETRKAKLASQSIPLFITNFNDVERTVVYSDYGIDLTGDWESLTGSPRVLVLDDTTGKGRLVPKPAADDTITLNYHRYPLKDITESVSKAELTDSRHLRLLVTYARARAYDDHDADTYDPKQADKRLAEFYTFVDEYTAQRKRKTRKAGTVKYGGL